MATTAQARLWVSLERARARRRHRRAPLLMHAGTGMAPRSRRCSGRLVLSTFAQLRHAIAPGFGCDGDELVVTHSTTDALCKILGGLELRAGDEIITTDHEHHAGNAAMSLARDRHGAVIRRVTLPVGDDQSAEDYRALFAAAITSRSRVLLFSAPTFTTGTMLPVVMLARLAQEHSLVSVVDGAHLLGMLDYRFHELGVDFLAGSGTKWQCGPAGTGILYARNKVLPQYNPCPLPRFWPVISIWYPPAGGLPARAAGSTPTCDIAEYLQTAGSESADRMSAFRRTCERWDRMGRDRIARHVLALGSYLKDRLVERWGIRCLYSPRSDPRLTSGLSTFTPFVDRTSAHDGEKFAELVARLRREHRIVVRRAQVPVPGSRAPHFALRISTGLFHDREDADRLVDAVASVAHHLS